MVKSVDPYSSTQIGKGNPIFLYLLLVFERTRHLYKTCKLSLFEVEVFIVVVRGICSLRFSDVSRVN
jgi:hypothetical protein